MQMVWMSHGDEAVKVSLFLVIFGNLRTGN
jgi:hypothetical protein